MKRSGSHEICPGVLALALLALTSCSQTDLNPVDWYHAIEGGKVADERPPPPQADAPYPNLGSVPTRPAPIDAPALGAIARGLVADRTNAQYSASLSPLPPLTTSANQINRPVPPTPRPAAEEAAASFPAASASPAASATKPIGPLGPPQLPLPVVPVTAPRRAPTQPVKSTALPAPTAAVPAPDVFNSEQNVGARTDVVIGQGRPAEPQSALPTVPTLPPPPPMLPGAGAGPPSVPGVAASPTSPPVIAPVAAVAPVVPVAASAASARATGQLANVLIAFAAGSSELPPTALASLKVMSQQRAGKPIAVTGFGDLTATEASAQEKALPLALERARVVASRLLALGVPADSIRISAEAQGRGAAARIVR